MKDLPEHIKTVFVPSPAEHPYARSHITNCIRIQTEEQHTTIVESFAYGRVPSEWAGAGLYRLVVRDDWIFSFERIDGKIVEAEQFIADIRRYQEVFDASILTRVQEVCTVFREARERIDKSEKLPEPEVHLRNVLGEDWVDPFPEYDKMKEEMQILHNRLNGVKDSPEEGDSK